MLNSTVLVTTYTTNTPAWGRGAGIRRLAVASSSYPCAGEQKLGDRIHFFSSGLGNMKE